MCITLDIKKLIALRLKEDNIRPKEVNSCETYLYSRNIMSILD